MDVPPADNPSMEEEDVSGDRGLGVEASGDHDDGAESGKELVYNVQKKGSKKKRSTKPNKKKN